MGASQLRRCIEGECRFWKDPESVIKKMVTDLEDNGFDIQTIEKESAIMRETLGKGYCLFEGI